MVGRSPASGDPVADGPGRRLGTTSRIDLAIRMHDPIREFLRQDVSERVSFAASLEALSSLVQGPAEGLGLV